MLERSDVDFYLVRERQELALAGKSHDPKSRAFHRGLAISYRQRALRAGLNDPALLPAPQCDEHAPLLDRSRIDAYRAEAARGSSRSQPGPGHD